MHTAVTVIGAGLGNTHAAYPDDIEAVLTAYEQGMFARSAEPVTFEGAEVHGIDSEKDTTQALFKMITEQGQRAA
ncbi:hypothetical protein [Streptomyces sp. NPDC101393]|uniref:hypothetical protein n=1 Tax=Streptomyces sp. NPDC101393 TaxID=3366141 RepID=UPI003811CFFE